MEKSLNFKVYSYGENEGNQSWMEYSSYHIDVGTPESSQRIMTFNNRNCKEESGTKSVLIPYTSYCHYLRYFPDESLTVPQEKYSGSSSLLVVQSILEKNDMKKKYKVIIGLAKDQDDADSEDFRRSLFQILTMLNMCFMFSERGFCLQISNRLSALIYKCAKEVLQLTLRKHHPDPHAAFQTTYQSIEELVNLIEHNELATSLFEETGFERSAKSLIFKTLTSNGLFPVLVEINTMPVRGLLGWLGRIMTKAATIFNSPWGSDFHASFIIGDRRFNFINDPCKKLHQDRLLVSDTSVRKFKENQSSLHFFQLKLFDFFPLDRWVEDIWQLLKEKLLNRKLRLNLSNKPNLKRNIIRDSQELTLRLAQDFYCEYIKVGPEPSKFDKNIPKETWTNFVAILADLELQRYDIATNNCQTVVSELVYLFSQSLQKYKEAKLEIKPDLLEVIYGQKGWKTAVLNALNKFGEEPELERVIPFRLVHKLDYFGFYADELTRTSLAIGNFKKTIGEPNWETVPRRDRLLL